MLRLDPSSPKPPFAQLCAQVVDLVATGGLTPGDRLPTVRRLAGDLGIAPNTVARAYRELEADGILEGRGRAGTFVAGAATGGRGADPRVEARSAADSYAQTIRSLGLAPSEALAMVRQALRV